MTTLMVKNTKNLDPSLKKSIGKVSRGVIKGDSKSCQKKSWLGGDDLEKLISFLKTRKNPIHLIITQIVLNTGIKFENLNKAQWDDFNSIKRTIRLRNKTIKLGKKLSDKIYQLRSKARSGNALIFDICFHSHWRMLRCALDSQFIENTNPYKSIRYAFIRNHWLHFRDKKMLADALGIKRLRKLPKDLFEIPTLPEFGF